MGLLRTILCVATICAVTVTAAREVDQVEIRGPVAVQRGFQVDLSGAFAISGARSSSCRVRYVAQTGLSCGSVLPEQFDCSYDGIVEFQHYGCFSDREIVTFHLSILPDSGSEWNTSSEIPVQFFSVEIVVQDSLQPLRNITLEHLRALPADHIVFTVGFPAELVGRCQYEIVTDDPLLPLPSVGHLEAPNQPLPCGFSPKEGFQYSNVSRSDYILVRVKTHSAEAPLIAYVILSVSMRGISENPVVQLSPVGLTVPQVTDMPIPTGLFPFVERGFKFVFTAHRAGSFSTVYASPRMLSHIAFTRTDLHSGLVAFLPNEDYINTTASYSYSVLDIAGALLARGRVEVHVLQRDWSWPSERTNRGLSVVEGGGTLIQPSQIDFYVRPNCAPRSSLRVVQGPLYGELTDINGTSLGGEAVPLSSIRNGTVAYVHSGSNTLMDGCVLEVVCGSSNALRTFLAIRVAPVDDTAPQLTQHYPLTLPPHFAFPLTPRVRDPDSPQSELSIHVSDLTGMLVRIDNPPALYQSRDAFFPYVKRSHFQRHAVSNVTEFTMTEVEQQLIWYLPPRNSSADTLELTMRDGTHTSPGQLHLSIGDLPLLLTTSRTYPDLIHNVPLPLPERASVYITTRYLYANALATPANAIVYHVQSPPQHGALCLLFQLDCNTSLTQFTQNDINLKWLFYHPTGGSGVDDFFNFTVTIGGVRSLREASYLFHMSAVERDPISDLDKQFWIRFGGKKRIAAKYLRPYVSLFPSKKSLTIRITSLPQYGTLYFDDTRTVQFSFQDLVSQHVWYSHDEQADFHCSDQIGFVMTNSSSYSVQGSLVIAVRHPADTALGVQSSSRTIFGQATFVFNTRDLHEQSSFCAEFVKYRIIKPPMYGVLSLYDMQYNTLIQLSKNSKFSAADVRSGLLQYSLTNPSPLSLNVSDTFYFELFDPQNNSTELAGTRRNTSYRFDVLIMIPNTGKIYDASIEVNSPQPLTWLPELGYGYILQPTDIQVNSSSVHPSEVIVNIRKHPNFGWIMRNNSWVSYFKLSHIQEGQVHYKSYLRNFRTLHQDSFQFSMVLNLTSAPFHVVHNQTFAIEWCIVRLEQHYSVQESAGAAQIVLRREGPNWFESSVVLTVRASRPESASPSANCSDPAMADFCSQPLTVFFPPGATSATVNITVFDDRSPEGPETFEVLLVSPVNAVVKQSRSSATVTISDLEDYAVIGFSGLEPPTHDFSCVLDEMVMEGAGSLILNLSRSGNLQDRVGVICYTDPALSSDFVPRPNSIESAVYFDPGETSAECRVDIVDDMDHEHTERFRVLLGEPIGLARVDPTTTPLCVLITSDPRDIPQVFFNVSEITVQESETREERARFHIRREGPDLRFLTEVSYHILLLPDDNATPDEDYVPLPADGRCGEGVGCVTFGVGEEVVEQSVVILPDRRREGNETLHIMLQSVENGRIRNSTLQITIIDGTLPATIEFPNSELWFLETQGPVSIPVRRRGYTSGPTIINCVLKKDPVSPNTANPVEDFLVPDIPQRVEFQPGQTEANCSVYLINDGRREGEETFIVKISSPDSEQGVVPPQDPVTVHILDPEDEPLVQFAFSRIELLEPLSNFPADETLLLLPLIRTGDLSLPSTLTYTPTMDTAQPGVDYVGGSTSVSFPEGVSTVNISIQVRANHDSEEDRTLYVVLTANYSLDPEVGVGDNATVEVVIANRPVIGTFFPDLPLLAGGGTVNSDLPLVCISSCDPEYPTDYSVECDNQRITPELTEFSWEASLDGHSFLPLSLATIFTSPRQRVLPPLYLSPGTFVRCSTQVRGSPSGQRRTSSPLLLSNATTCPTPHIVEAEAELSSYSSFSGSPEDLLKLTITLPHIPHTLPLVSTRPLTQSLSSLLTHPPTTSLHSCSNLIPPSLGDNSLLQGDGEEAELYYHGNSCQWEFGVWLPLLTLQTECSDTTSSVSDSVTVPVYAMYIHIDISGTIVTTAVSNTTAILTGVGEESPLSVPFDTYPASGQRDAYVYPVAVQSGPGFLTVFLYSVALFPGHFVAAVGGRALVRRNAENLTLTLLHTSTTPQEVRQAWQVEGPPTTTLHISLAPCVWEDSSSRPATSLDCDPGEPYLFSLPLSGQPPELRPTVTATLHHGAEEDQLENSTTNSFSYGDVVYGEVVLSPFLSLRPTFFLLLHNVLLCRGRDRQLQDCSEILDRSMGVANADFDAAFSPFEGRNRMGFQFGTDPLYSQNASGGVWYVHLMYSTGEEVSTPSHTQHTALPLSLLPRPTDTPSPSDSPSSSHNSTENIFLYASVAIVVSAILLVGVGFAVSGFMVGSWRSRQRELLKQVHSEEVKNSEKVRDNRKGKHKEEEEEEEKVFDLRRTHSTTSFPTAEKYNRHRKKPKKPPTPLDLALQHAPLTHSQSLPNLFLDPTKTEPFFREPRPRILRKPLATIKVLNTEQTSLRLWSAVLRAQRDFAPIKVIQNDLGQKNSELASYAVRSLAASANTPEPGSSPATEL